jgi:hypothetical protein
VSSMLRTSFPVLLMGMKGVPVYILRLCHIYFVISCRVYKVVGSNAISFHKCRQRILIQRSWPEFYVLKRFCIISLPVL